MMLVDCLIDGALAAVAAVGFAAISRPTKRIAVMAGLLAAAGHMSRFLLLQASMGIASASLCAGLIISFCSMPIARRCHTPAEMFVFPALLPMIPGMFAYKAILATLKFLNTAGTVQGEAVLVSVVYNGLTAFFIMCALAIGAILPLLLFHREAPLGRTLHRLSQTGKTA